MAVFCVSFDPRDERKRVKSRKNIKYKIGGRNNNKGSVEAYFSINHEPFHFSHSLRFQRLISSSTCPAELAFFLFLFLRFAGERRLALPRVCLRSIEERKNKITPVLQALSQTDQKPGI